MNNNGDKMRFPLSEGAQKRSGKKVTYRTPKVKKNPLPQERELVATKDGTQRTYRYSAEAMTVLAAAKKEKYKLDKFVSDAIVEYGKSALSSGDLPPLRRRQKILERIVAAIGMQLLNEFDPKDRKKIIKCAKEKAYPPYDNGLTKKYAQCSEETGLLSGEDTNPLWWIVFYALENDMIK